MDAGREEGLERASLLRRSRFRARLLELPRPIRVAVRPIVALFECPEILESERGRGGRRSKEAGAGRESVTTEEATAWIGDSVGGPPSHRTPEPQDEGPGVGEVSGHSVAPYPNSVGEKRRGGRV